MRKILVYIMVFLVLVLSVQITYFVKPEPVQCFALTSTMVLGIMLALSCCGLYGLNYEAVNKIAVDCWNKASDTVKGLIFDGVDESDRTFTFGDPVFDYFRQYITDNYVVGDYIHSLPSLRVMTEWGVSYLYTPIAFDMGGSFINITEELYNDAIKYSSITWLQCNKQMVVECMLSCMSMVLIILLRREMVLSL